MSEEKPKCPPNHYYNDGGCLVFIIAGVLGLILTLA